MAKIYQKSLLMIVLCALCLAQKYEYDIDKEKVHEHKLIDCRKQPNAAMCQRISARSLHGIDPKMEGAVPIARRFAAGEQVSLLPWMPNTHK